MDAETWNTPGRKEQPIEGRFRWLATAILTTELLLSWKYREGTGNLIDAPTPFYIWFPWTATILGAAGFWFYLRFKKGHTVKYPGFEADLHKVKNS
jgi:hypothetical protein